MLEYTSKYWKMLIPLTRKGLVKRYGREYTRELLVKADGIYRELLNRADDIGKENPMASNIYEALVFFAIWDASDRKITVDELRSLANEVMSAPVLKVVGLWLNLNKPSGVRKLSAMIKKDGQWMEEHPQYKDVSWDFHFDEEKDKGGLYYHFTQCPINTFARREGYLEILPVMCDIDFKTASLMHANLHRKYTLAKGGEMCDYWFIGDRIDPTEK